MKSSRNGKAPGSDKLPTDLFKNTTITIKKRLLAFYSKILSGVTIPEDFHTAIVIPIFKKGDRNDPGNYSGISLVNAAYKILAKMLVRRIESHAKPIILECQNGFQKGRSCIDRGICNKAAEGEETRI